MTRRKTPFSPEGESFDAEILLSPYKKGREIGGNSGGR
jgi:hypothetical protein